MDLKDAGIYDLVNIFKGQIVPSTRRTTRDGGIIDNTPRKINIPAYQRPYRWKKENIERLFQDYDDNNDAEYFIGAAVAVKKKVDENAIEFDLVDGQQRITTMFLLNYIRFLLKREFVYKKLSKFNLNAQGDFSNLRECYVDLIGKGSKRFDRMLVEIDDLNKAEDLDPKEAVDKLVECFKKEMCIPVEKDTEQETKEERLKQNRAFFENEELCLKYSRPKYDKILKDALCNVYLKESSDTNDYILEPIIQVEDEDQFSQNYIDALEVIFNCVWGKAKKITDKDSRDRFKICAAAVKYADELISNMLLCIVLTENEKDANKLFEVLNDRSLDVDDLELIKNHFYKEYCTKSKDTDDIKDKHINLLDELWTDKIFSGNTVSHSKLISYFAAVYLTGDKDLPYKDDSKLKDAIASMYSARFYCENPYNFENILADFNVYLAIKIILTKYDIRSQKWNDSSLKAEQQTDKSISYKTLHLLVAMKYYAVIPALINIIIATYRKSKSMTDDDFEKSFSEYIDDIIKDSKHTNATYQNIHNCAYVLWIATIKGKDYKKPREIARRLIEKNNYLSIQTENVDLYGSELSDLNSEFEQWMNSWDYSNSTKTFIIKVLLLNLLQYNRNPADDGFSKMDVVLSNSALNTYNLDAGKLQLDHLEANKIVGNSTSYFMSADLEQRGKYVNNYIGNFMILDATENNKKNNVPLHDALPFYSKISSSWMIKDIQGMMADNRYFDLTNNLPKEEFFKVRTLQLKSYFRALLGRKLNDESFDVHLS